MNRPNRRLCRRTPLNNGVTMRNPLSRESGRYILRVAQSGSKNAGSDHTPHTHRAGNVPPDRVSNRRPSRRYGTHPTGDTNLSLMHRSPSPAGARVEVSR